MALSGAGKSCFFWKQFFEFQVFFGLVQFLVYKEDVTQMSRPTLNGIKHHSPCHVLL